MVKQMQFRRIYQSIYQIVPVMIFVIDCSEIAWLKAKKLDKTYYRLSPNGLRDPTPPKLASIHRAQMSRRIAIPLLLPQFTNSHISLMLLFFGFPHWTAEFKVISWPAMAYPGYKKVCMLCSEMFVSQPGVRTANLILCQN
ncbi:hypothetical protein PROFUN_04310 [Planoprotostelium fungivorum]|uniref:Uncharacterized protein n=1 Tax=Planoprotostelium fungivorum TaxID=1890364 RepID=A0A2P6NV90_9EUKA|nr:hypothetical protein PROFUN_04310 [Planoprotostelium fungivorum]